MTDTEIVIPQFGHYVKLASTVSALPGGLGYTVITAIFKLLRDFRVIIIYFRVLSNHKVAELEAVSLQTIAEAPETAVPLMTTRLHNENSSLHGGNRKYIL